MKRNKIGYGIDLGTTNSAICRMEKGEPVIIKTDGLKDTMPSCVSVNRKGSIRGGDSAFNALKSEKLSATKPWQAGKSNSYVEFKRTMATNTLYSCSNLGKNFTSEELSAEVLKTLKSFVTDEELTSAVITVPAKFNVNQKTATLEAAKLAGFKKCELLQEPIAASMAYGLSSNEKDGIWMVFDFGGGTFDAALVNVEDGIMQVFDTEGDNYLGGKNLDYAIVDNIIIPYLRDNYSIEGILKDVDKKSILRDAMKTYAEEIKNQLSFKESEDIISDIGELGIDEEGEELEVDLTLTQNQVFEVFRPVFQRAVDICKDLLSRNNLSGVQLNKLILVGGPTHNPLIRQMLREQITPNVDTSIDPMTAVATGAALYASTIDAETEEEEINLKMDTLKLDVDYEATSVQLKEYVSIKLANPSNSFSRVYVELERADKGWSSGRVEIDEKGDVVEVNLVESRPNSFTINAYDNLGNRMPCFPEEFTIIQGTKVGAAPLPYNIGIGVWSKQKERRVFRMAKGLEKNRSLPAIGVVNDLKTTNALRPGLEADKVLVPVYQTDDFKEAEGRNAALYEHVADVVITGDDVNQYIPENSSVDLTLKVDSSEQMTLEVHFLASDITVEKSLDTSRKQSVEEAEKEIKKGLVEAEKGLRELSSATIPVEDLKQKLEAVKTEYANSSEKKMVLQHLKEVLRKIEDLDSKTEWPRLEKKLREDFEDLERAQNEFGTFDTKRELEQIREEVDRIILSKDISRGREMIKKIDSLYFQLTYVYQCIGFLEYWNKRVETVNWKDKNRARQLLDRGLKEAANQPTSEKLRPIVVGILDLLPEEEKENAGGLLK